MRIAQVAPLQVAVPPQGYGGTERVVAELTEALVRLGHEVTLFASGDSHTSARLVPIVAQALHFAPEVDVRAYHVAMLDAVYAAAAAGRFDVIHAHLDDALTLPYARRSATPTVLTLHGDLHVHAGERHAGDLQAGDLTAPYTFHTLHTPQALRADALRAQTDASSRRTSPMMQSAPQVHTAPQAQSAYYVSISDAQRAGQPALPYIATIHHGVDVASFPFSATPGSYLAFVGRMSPEKRPDLAIAIARRAGIPLKLAAKVDQQEAPYFREVIQPLLDDPLIEWLGEVDEPTKRELLVHARALLLPIDWPEPFGMVFIEALACGTPILTCPIGSVPELLEDGVTGYSRMEVEELVAAAQRVHHISRHGCRAYAQRGFDTQLMAAKYVNVYHQLLRYYHHNPQGLSLVEMPEASVDSTGLAHG